MSTNHDQSVPTVAWLGMVFLVFTVALGCDRRGASRAGGGADAGASRTPVPISNMVPIRAGTYMRIKFPVTITRDFWIGKYEVTQGEFAALMGRNPSHFTGDSNRPMEKVSFLEASKYCTALSQQERDAGRLPAGYEYRLPTEGEWEYACRAGNTNFYSFGGDTSVADQFAWTAENSDATSHPVGLKQPNSWGLHDMHGNVWEWCSDWFEAYPAGSLTNPVGPASGKFKVFRGGGWNQDIEYARASNRFMMSPSNGIHFVGFRIVLSGSAPDLLRDVPLPVSF